ncbi:polysaccharide pyruvyl transferase family protein [Brachybacterium sp. MASK1Z-5]|uniref:Polysaccharide pyruvyl transferase family protein n=1 Tax=Brachybacterium halotolerans TaxID=2795215 RepID=A0ABS1B7U8_9MICO|nr:polysaccharide pyruvyl transferase family protein [Brachybacterium halotolerans]
MEIGLIGINKYARFLNFACQLHAYAFQKFLEKNGYSSTILDYKPVTYGDHDMRSPAAHAEKEYRQAVMAGASPAKLERLADLAVGYRSLAAERASRFDRFQDFERRNLTVTEEQYDSELLEIQDPGFDCYICVTDVIWSADPTYTFDRGFLLGSKAFEGKPKIAYAASRGISKDFTGKTADIFFSYLGEIEAIGVREPDLEAYIEQNSDLDATTVLDPVLLHDGRFWRDLAVAPREEKYLLLYYVMGRSADTVEKAVEYAKLHDLTIVELSDRPLKYGQVNDPEVRHVARYDVGQDEWLGYIENAECVFTNSFHGCCFSLLFETPFFVGKRMGKKVPNFLATFGLQGQQFAPDDDVRTLSSDVDFRSTDAPLRSMREHSEAFIFEALRRAEASIADGTAIDRERFEQRRREIQFPVHFHSGSAGRSVALRDEAERVKTKVVPSGALEYWWPGRRFVNDGRSPLPRGEFVAAGRAFVGWAMRFRIDNRWLWYLADGSFATSEQLTAGGRAAKAVIPDGARIPHMPVNHISSVVFEARWKKDETSLPVDSGQDTAATGTPGGRFARGRALLAPLGRTIGRVRRAFVRGE